MPNPVPLATKEEEERRAWVTNHHECVRLIKDCFGDRFSNNEIFDRLKISRRTGYRALGNDDRIGKAPGRKSKILDSTVQEMIEFIENGKCNEVGNVWKYLATQFAPDCNPKTVQDAVKKAGFKNYHNNEKLVPLLNEQLNEHESAPAEEEAARRLQHDQAEQQHAQQVQQARQAEQAHSDEQQRQQLERHQQQRHQQQNHNLFDPALQQYNPQDLLRSTIQSLPPESVRHILLEIVGRNHDAMMMAHQWIFPPAFPTQHSNVAPPVAQMGLHTHMNAQPPLPTELQSPQVGNSEGSGVKRRSAICRRCNTRFYRAENTMNTRECLYHKGSVQKTDLKSPGTIEQVPEAWTWSCCAGNGGARGCCRAMHTTKKKRKYTGKKRSASAAGLDENGNNDGINGGESGNGGLEGFDMNGGAGSPGADDDDDPNGDDGGMNDATLLQGSPPSPQSAAASALSSQDMSSFAHPFGQGMVGAGPESGTDVMGMPLQMSGPGRVPSDADIDGSLQQDPRYSHQQAQQQQQQAVVPSQQDGQYSTGGNGHVHSHQHQHHQQHPHQQHDHHHHQLQQLAGLPMTQSSHDIYGQAQLLMGHESQHGQHRGHGGLEYNQNHHKHPSQQQQQQQHMSQLQDAHNEAAVDHGMSAHAQLGSAGKIED